MSLQLNAAWLKLIMKIGPPPSRPPDRLPDPVGRPRRGPRDQQAARSMVPVRTAVPVRAVVRKQIASPFGSPTVLSDRAVRGFQPCYPQVPASRRRGFRRVLG
jgi:hypothetical protein